MSKFLDNLVDSVNKTFKLAFYRRGPKRSVTISRYEGHANSDHGELLKHTHQNEEGREGGWDWEKEEGDKGEKEREKEQKPANNKCW